MTWQRLVFDIMFGLGSCALFISLGWIDPDRASYYLLGYFGISLVFALFRKEEK